MKKARWCGRKMIKFQDKKNKSGRGQSYLSNGDQAQQKQGNAAVRGAGVLGTAIEKSGN